MYIYIYTHKNTYTYSTALSSILWYPIGFEFWIDCWVLGLHMYMWMHSDACIVVFLVCGVMHYPCVQHLSLKSCFCITFLLHVGRHCLKPSLQLRTQEAKVVAKVAKAAKVERDTKVAKGTKDRVLKNMVVLWWLEMMNNDHYLTT